MVNPTMTDAMFNPTMTNAMFNQFMQNPFQFLLQRKIKIPNEYANNPQGAVQYLMSTGRMSQETFEGLRNRASQMGVNI